MAEQVCGYDADCGTSVSMDADGRVIQNGAVAIRGARLWLWAMQPKLQSAFTQVKRLIAAAARSFQG
jgi:hypothetical protein